MKIAKRRHSLKAYVEVTEGKNATLKVVKV